MVHLLNPAVFNPYKNAFFSAENVLGSFGFSMRVNPGGKSFTVTVYDSKTIESITDHLMFNMNVKRTPESSSILSTTYQRYIWNVNVPLKQ